MPLFSLKKSVKTGIEKWIMVLKNIMKAIPVLRSIPQLGDTRQNHSLGMEFWNVFRLSTR
jgi:hypothetical protein